MSGTHAKLSPSGASKYMNCPGSPVLEAAFPDESSIYADEGTAAHTLAQMCLTSGCSCADFLGEQIRVDDRSFEVTHDMADAVQLYVDFVNERAEGKMLLVEVSVPIGHLTGEEDATGTADAIIVDATNRRLTVIDLKFGRGVGVEATGNKQGQKYALGALEQCSLLGDFDEVEIGIFQPRIAREPKLWITSTADLNAFAETVAAAADTVRAAQSKFPGYDDEAALLDWSDAYLRPGIDQCRFCKAKGTCPALRAEMTEIVGGASPAASAEDFAQFVPTEVVDTGHNYLSIAMGKVDLVEQWCLAVRAEMLRLMETGVTFEDWKLVEGRQGNRAWRDKAEAEAKLKSFRLKKDDLYKTSLIGPTDAERLLKKTKPKQWAQLEQDFISRAAGRPSVAAATDPRPALAVVATAEDFRQMTEAE